MARSATTGRFVSPKHSPLQGAARKGLHVTMYLRGVEELSAKASAAEPNISRALEAAHEASAVQMQLEIVQALQDKIDDRGRVQRPTQFLINALKSEKLRNVTIRGFTIGGFERLSGPEGQVKYYARNLEIGTDIHKGQEFYGMFLPFAGAGYLLRPTRDTEAQKDMRLIRFLDQSGAGNDVIGKNGKHYTAHPPLVRIGKGITGYHFFEAGTQAFRESHGLVQLDFYNKYLAPLGVDFITRWVSRHGGSGPRGSDVTVRTAPGTAQQFD